MDVDDFLERAEDECMLTVTFVICSEARRSRSRRSRRTGRRDYSKRFCLCSHFHFIQHSLLKIIQTPFCVVPSIPVITISLLQVARIIILITLILLVQSRSVSSLIIKYHQFHDVI